MHKIFDDFLECVVYLYSFGINTENSETVGGSGFLVLLPFEYQTAILFM